AAPTTSLAMEPFCTARSARVLYNPSLAETRVRSSYNDNPVPSDGAPIGYSEGRFQIPDNPILPYIEGDGTGRDIWKASRRVFDGAVKKAYSGKRRVAWYEVFAGEKAFAKFKTWLPDDSVE